MEIKYKGEDKPGWIYEVWLEQAMGSRAELLTDGCEDVGEAEVVHCIEGEQVIEELLLFIITAQEGVTLVQLPVRQDKTSKHQNTNKSVHFHSRWVRNA